MSGCAGCAELRQELQTLELMLDTADQATREMRRERDEAIKRASDATMECGRLEERLRHTEHERDQLRRALEAVP